MEEEVERYNDEVMELTDETFKEIIQSVPNVLVNQGIYRKLQTLQGQGEVVSNAWYSRMMME